MAKETCAESVMDYGASNFGHLRQCERKAGHGPDDKYCAQHAEKFAEGETVTWFKADVFSEYSVRIEPVEVLKTTKTSLLIKEEHGTSRVKKTDKWNRYFPTRVEAVSFYRNRIAGIRGRADKLERQLNALANN